MACHTHREAEICSCADPDLCPSPPYIGEGRSMLTAPITKDVSKQTKDQPCPGLSYLPRTGKTLWRHQKCCAVSAQVAAQRRFNS